eukprot:scaffold253990_cov31-Tisochrysis_lutea.AAC.5
MSLKHPSNVSTRETDSTPGVRMVIGDRNHAQRVNGSNVPTRNSTGVSDKAARASSAYFTQWSSTKIWRALETCFAIEASCFEPLCSAASLAA